MDDRIRLEKMLKLLADFQSFCQPDDELSRQILAVSADNSIEDELNEEDLDELAAAGTPVHRMPDPHTPDL